jgi:GxxExxY protein
MLIHSEITEKIIKAFYNVYDVLGYGFLEKVYEKAMLIELKNLGL